MKKYGIIYKITNLINGKVYIGQTIEKRGFKGRYEYSGEGIERIFNYYEHFKTMNRHYNSHLYNAIKKYGFGAFEVIEEFDVAYSKEELDELEKKYIKEFNCLNPNGYNDQIGGNTHKVSEITKQKMSENNSGEGNPMYGKKHSKETRQKLSENHADVSGENNPMYGKRGKDNPNYGSKRSEETKRKIRESHVTLKGEKCPTSKIIYCEDLNKYWFGSRECAEDLNLSSSGVRGACRSGKIYRGYKLKYIIREELDNIIKK